MIDEKERKELLALIEQIQDENLLREIADVLGIDTTKWDATEPLPSSSVEAGKDKPNNRPI